MFWRVATFQQISPVEVILDRDDCSLEQLLDEDEIIQECKSANTRLVAYLNKRETIATLISYLSEPPDNDADFRYSFTACEIFCCELDELFNTLMEDDALMASLFCLLDKPAPLNSALVGYFGRVVGSLLSKRPDRTHAYLQAHPELLTKLVTHIDTTSIVEVVLRLVGADEMASSLALSDTLSDWLASTELMQLLLERLCRDTTDLSRAQRRLQKAAQRNVASILVAIASTQPSPLANQLTQRVYLRTMLVAAADPASDLLSPVLQVCIALLEPVPTLPTLSAGWSALVPPAQPDDADVEAVSVADNASMHAAAEEIIAFLPAFTALLDVPDDDAEQQQPYGTLKPRLGRRRLTVIEFGKALLASRMPLTVKAIMASEFVPKAMTLFEDFPFNNILHNYVYQIFDSLLDTLQPPGTEGDSPGARDESPDSASALPDVVSFLVDDCGLLEWIVQLASSIYVRPSSKNFEIKKPSKLLRAAYHGHVTDLANKVLDIARQSNNGALITALQLSNEWQTYEVDVLAPRTKVQDVNDWQVGRPPTTDHTISSQDEEDEGSLRPLQHFMGKQDDDENPMAMQEYSSNTFMPDYSQQRYASDSNEDDAGSDGSANSVEDPGPESHHIEDEDDDSDSSDPGHTALYSGKDLPDSLEPQTIEDEDAVELGDEASALAEEVEEDSEQGQMDRAFDALALSAGADAPAAAAAATAAVGRSGAGGSGGADALARGWSALDKAPVPSSSAAAASAVRSAQDAGEGGAAAGEGDSAAAADAAGGAAAAAASADEPEKYNNYWKMPLKELSDDELDM